MEDDIRGLGDYLAVLSRRKAHFVAAFAVIMMVSIITLFILPSIYRSSATILIEQQEIPADLVRSTVTSYADQRIHLISQQVMTSANLQRIIERFGLYQEELQAESIITVIETMREDIQLEMINAEVVDPTKGKAVEASIAFTLSYMSEFPGVAQKVANELVTLFMNENLKQRTKLAVEASSFLAEEAGKLKTQVAELEQNLADFKEKNVGQLPELVELNLQLMERVERELTGVEGQIRSLEEREIYLNSELLQLSPNSVLYSEEGDRILSSRDRLKALRSKYITDSAIYKENHPDLIKLRKEIAALEKETDAEGGVAEFQQELESLRAELVGLEERYSDQHPDVKKIQRLIASAQENLDKELAREAAVKEVVEEKPDNPAYIQLRAQLKATETDLASLRSRRGELKAKLADFESRLIQTPQVEREYLALSRDYENALVKYQEIKAKQMEAELAENLEKEHKAERFSLIEPPQMPDEPESPNRPAILLLGFILSFAGGLGVVAVAESLDGALHGARGVFLVARTPPLAVIPYIENDADRRQKTLRTWLTATVSLVLFSGVLLLIHVFFMPLDVLWFVALRRIGLS